MLTHRAISVLAGLGLLMAENATATVVPDFSRFSPDCGVTIRSSNERLHVSWPTGESRTYEVTLDLREGSPLIESLGGVLKSLDPFVSLTIGTRSAPPGRPPEMSIWNTFFDNPHKRPYQTHVARIAKSRAVITSTGKRATVAIGDLTAGPFSGEVCFTFFAGCPLVKLEAVMSTSEDRTAYVFDLGLIGDDAGWRSLSWTDAEGRLQEREVDEDAPDEALAVRHRMLAVTSEDGALAIFPPPHQFFYPLDWTTNTKNFWHGENHQNREGRFGIGVRHDPRGAGNFVPWFNAPPGTRQRPGLFLLIDPGDAKSALDAALRYTRGDRFAPLPGMTTFTSHYHMAVAVAAMDQARAGVDPLPEPEFVETFKAMGVQAVHLGEFHGDGHPQDPGPLRLPEMKAMFDECARLSDHELLVIPGEEANKHLGIPFPGRHPGHWMLLFPKPVYWTMVRAEGQPLAEPHPQFGTVYHVGSRDDMVAVIKRERGLAWTAHPRIKASSWTPDIFRREDFFKDDLWLGAAFKAMPADLSRERLGERCLDLLDDMCNWGERKYLPGEVDVFKLDHTHELYGHMNINYLRLPKMPCFEDGWQPVLDALRSGAFFTTTGEVLIKSFTVDGKQSGESVKLPGDSRAEVKIDLDWTFPMKFAEIISGDGKKVYRERIELSDSTAFESRTITLSLDLKGCRWVRFEAWDVAANGAYSQPVWLE